MCSYGGYRTTQAFGENDVNAIANSTGRPYLQTYMGRVVAENGKIKLIREAHDMAIVAKGMFPNGLVNLAKLRFLFFCLNKLPSLCIARGAFNRMVMAEIIPAKPDTDNTGVGMHWLFS